MPDHANFAGSGGDRPHQVRFEAGSVPEVLYGPQIDVNSLHHQTLARLGEGVRAVGWSTGGGATEDVVEAIEAEGDRVLGVQWHPERAGHDVLSATRDRSELTQARAALVGTREVGTWDRLFEEVDVVFSVDSYKKDDYERIRVGGIFETVLDNIKKFGEIRKEFYPNSKCATRVSGVRVDKELDMSEFKKFWEEYVDHVVLVQMENRWDTYHNPLEVGAESPCDYLWERMYVWFDGICNPCDADYKSELKLGSIKENSLKEIWHSKRFSDIREKHIKNQRNECFPCDRCPIGS